MSATALQTFGDEGRDSGTAALNEPSDLIGVQLTHVGSLGIVAIAVLSPIDIRARCLEENGSIS